MEDVLIIGALFLFLLFWVWALLDLAFSTFKSTRWKLAWLLVILFFPLVGSLVYLLLRKDFKAKKRRHFQPHYRFQSGKHHVNE